DIEKINGDIKKFDDVIKNFNNDLADLEQKFPAQLKSIDGKKLDQEIKLIMNEITKLNTQIKDAQINFLKEYKNFIGSSNSTIKFNTDKIKSSLKEQEDKIIEKFEKKYKELAKEFNKITKNNILKDISDFIIELENEIGGLEKEINLNLKEIKKLRVKNKKILKNFNIDDLSDKDLTSTFQKIRDEKIIYEEAIEILKESQEKIVKKVLPKTMENLTKILPLLTADRYKDAWITPDYKVKVFDSKLGDYVGKVLFSGGTNDQIALAMRLAFAMATMQKNELQESFIFLDEPLGFFDDERKNALIDFLTHGLIAEMFSQRFVVSNFQDIKQYFDFVIELENGKIIKQYATGTLESTKLPFEYEVLEGPDFLILEEIDCDEEDGYCEIKLNLVNKSDYPLKRVELKIEEFKMNISPEIIFNFQPSKSELLLLSFNRLDYNLLNIPIKTIIEYQKDNNKLVRKRENLTYSFKL
ncbi:MAG: ATP-binding protein, partial [Promethearchaeia archaeon]